MKRWVLFGSIVILAILVLSSVRQLWLQAQETVNGSKYLANLADAAKTKLHKKSVGFLVSYQTKNPPENNFDRALRDVAFTYDNAVAAIAFIATGDRLRAKQLVDSLVYAQNHDRFYEDGRLRNAYQGGKLDATADPMPLPGWWDRDRAQWVEDAYQVGSETGNMAWAILAWLSYYEIYGNRTYLQAATRLGKWIEANCRDTRGRGGYTAGFRGWEPEPTPLRYKSTEHNIDLYVAFSRLYQHTRRDMWREGALAAKQFVMSMWDQQAGKFWTGTTPDGVTINRTVIPLDIHSWALLAFSEKDLPNTQQILDYVETHHQTEDGFDFNQDGDGIWYEGTAHMALAYRSLGKKRPTKRLLAFLQASQHESGALFASNREGGITTGFFLDDGSPWLYFRRLHVGATAWYMLAESGVNPFWVKKNPSFL
ncbi:hypothetical protein [Geitlerinema sp. PCC 9228]|jgi:hypothetical protein|uniref:hypothetical protein n=1 Tax=Geitlerinema sp. PCC 9228 TaxID=111611 RepID=UPI000A047897|nr:hypothetical protein [Geitlerinema sp. PCC 9228]